MHFVPKHFSFHMGRIFKQLIELTGQRIDGRITDWVEYRREGGGKTLEMLMTYAALMHGL